MNSEHHGLPVTDGLVTLRATRPGDAALLIAGRDDEFRRWLGPGSPAPQPTAVIEVDGELVGWVDHDPPGTHDWLRHDQCNVGYHVFATHRGRGIAISAVRLLLELMRASGACAEAAFLVDAENEASLRVARAVGAEELDRFDDEAGRPQVLLAASLRRVR